MLKGVIIKMHKSQKYEQKETELCDKIRNLLEELDRLDKEGKDTTETLMRLETALEDVRLFKQNICN
ncbi:MAG TPA: hypothetical protein PKA28_16040 [Methylomusa anaerophila]|uniref:hypothetical protein n=1 Tax=Methylomusa anaerophila TaxID=1930071 RepID=UPI0011AE93AB|nr:hypothetical protein [Methylomusa anaerophila]HML89956.1 hypothetical protein [Methylomusa anaerophila]